MTSEANFRLFETKHVLRILVFLHLCGPKSKSDIYRAVSTNPIMTQKLAGESLTARRILPRSRCDSAIATAL
ncbi:MAG: hypothetical protein J5812_04620 [Candidatus Methanomethylophilaceae archaeon]|nr:hypothetical protein [Candidatus Methanomethylophilaceae archaeon]